MSDIIGASIDIGRTNLCLYAEKFDIDKLHKIKNIPIKKRYTSSGTPTPEFKKMLNEIYMNGKDELLEVKDIAGNTDAETLINFTRYLDSKKTLFDKCKYILIEQQEKKSSLNMRLEHHCSSYFYIVYEDSIQVIIFPSYYKTKTLGMEKYKRGMKAYQRKKMRKEWTCILSKNIAKLRNDDKLYKNICSSMKQDDKSDAIAQQQAFKLKCFIDKKY